MGLFEGVVYSQVLQIRGEILISLLGPINIYFCFGLNYNLFSCLLVGDFEVI